jgi:hypothetical protein
VVLAAPAVLTPLVTLTGAVDRMLPATGLAPLTWSERYDDPPAVAVNLHGRGPQSHEVLRALAPGRLVAFGTGDHAGPTWFAEEHETRRWCRLVEESLGLATDPQDLLLPPPATAAPAPGAVVVHPGAAYPSRRWPPARFAEVARGLAGDGHRVVVTGGPGEVALAEEVAALAGLGADAVLAGRTDLAALAAQVASAALVVCGDTGVAHLATSFGTPSVLLFGPVSPRLWGPVTDGPHTVLWHGVDRPAGDPWGDDVDPALLAATVPEVLAAARAHLVTPPPHPASPG